MRVCQVIKVKHRFLSSISACPFLSSPLCGLSEPGVPGRVHATQVVQAVRSSHQGVYLTLPAFKLSQVVEAGHDGRDGLLDQWDQLLGVHVLRLACRGQRHGCVLLGLLVPGDDLVPEDGLQDAIHLSEMENKDLHQRQHQTDVSLIRKSFWVAPDQVFRFSSTDSEYFWHQRQERDYDVMMTQHPLLKIKTGGWTRINCVLVEPESSCSALHFFLFLPTLYFVLPSITRREHCSTTRNNRSWDSSLIREPPHPSEVLNYVLKACCLYTGIMSIFWVHFHEPCAESVCPGNERNETWPQFIESNCRSQTRIKHSYLVQLSVCKSSAGKKKVFLGAHYGVTDVKYITTETMSGPQHQQSSPNWGHTVPFPYVKCLYGLGLQYIWVADCLGFVVFCHFSLETSIFFDHKQRRPLALSLNYFTWLSVLFICILRVPAPVRWPIHRHFTPVITPAAVTLYNPGTAPAIHAIVFVWLCLGEQPPGDFECKTIWGGGGI